MQNKSLKIFFLTILSISNIDIQSSLSKISRALKLGEAVYEQGGPIVMPSYNLQQGDSFYFVVHTEDVQGKQTQLIIVDSSSTKGFERAAFIKALKQYTNGIFLDFITKVEGSTKNVTVSWQAYSQDGQIIPTIAGSISKTYTDLKDAFLEYFAYKITDNTDQIVGGINSQVAGRDSFENKKRYNITNVKVIFPEQKIVSIPASLTSDNASDLWLSMTDPLLDISYLIVNGPESQTTSKNFTYDITNHANMSYVQNQIANDSGIGAGIPTKGLVLSLVEVDNQVYLYLQDNFGNQVGHCLLPGMQQIPAVILWDGSYISPTVTAYPKTQSAVLMYGSKTSSLQKVTIPPYPWKPKNS